MFAGEYFLAVALFLAPPGTKVPALSADQDAPVRAALQTVAIQWEILDPRETRYMLTRAEDLQEDLDLLRNRVLELADAPPLWDCLRFPDRAVVTELLSFNRSYKEYIEAAQPMHASRLWEVRSALRETEELYNIWDRIRDARCEYYHVNVRRRALKKLREMIGPDAYYKGELPPHVPVWRFQMID